MPGICPRCNREVFFAEERLALGKVWHTFCFSCRNCRKLLDSCSVATHCGELFCKNCYTRLTLPNVRTVPDQAIRPEVKSISPAHSAYVAISVSGSTNCNCCHCVEDQLNDSGLYRKESVQPGKRRLRGGGNEEEEINFQQVEGTNHPVENECNKVDGVNSATTICNSVSSHISETTCYNQQHSSCKSSPTPEHSEKNSFDTNGKGDAFRKTNGCRYIETQKGSGHLNCDCEINITNPELSADRDPKSTDCDIQIITYHSDRELNISGTIIPSRRKYTYPPIPPPRSPQPSRRRVSFCEVVFGDKNNQDQCRTTRMQDNRNKYFCNNDNTSCNTSYDVWRAEDVAGKSDGGYENDVGITNMNYNEDGTKLRYSNNDANCSNNESVTESYANRIADDKDTEDSAQAREPSAINNYKNSGNVVSSSDEFEDDQRMRGGCGGLCTVYSSKNANCDSCGRCSYDSPNCCPTSQRCYTRSCDEPCPPRDPDPCRIKCIDPCLIPPCLSSCAEKCGSCPSSEERLSCKKNMIKCLPPCNDNVQGCGTGGCCGSGCRGGCGKPGQKCMPARPCTNPPCIRPRSPALGSPCSPSRPCTPQPPCCRQRKPVTIGECGNYGGTSCCRSRSPRCGAAPCRTISPRSRPTFTCTECLGGGLDCQRCGRKVYQAEMQIASGVPYHNICFSCFCCRKPLEPLTYLENCGEIYCKQCYVRNFGPQGYGYGMGAGALQTPL